LERVRFELVARKQASNVLEWFETLPCSVTVCDRDYKILYMNGRAAEVTKEDGGKSLIGQSLLDCHPPKARKKLREVMASGKPNAYTVEKHGVRKQVYQSHWKRGGRVAGLVEISFEIPSNMPNRKRA
jgi:transcriptional regulator with PAS, ATPase and Fis domain